jgi:hypothetical protein
MIPNNAAAAEVTEPELRTVSTFAVRNADSHIDGLVEQILELLAGGTRIVDLSSHDRRGTVIELRAQNEETLPDGD